MNVKSIVTILLIAVVSMAFVGSASAATYYVNPGDSIQAAINGAADGDTIILNDGDYTENVVVNKSVAVISYGMSVYLEAQGVEIGGDWWLCWSNGLCWDIDYIDFWNYQYDYDGAVVVTAADPKQDVFRVTSDDVIIMNVNLDYENHGSDFYWDAGADTYFWGIPIAGWWYAGYYEWYESIHDNPMGLSGADKTGAAGVYVDGATGTDLFNLQVTGCDNGIKAVEATDTTIELCEMLGNNKEGLLVLSCDGVYVYDCVVTDSGKRGIEVENSANVVMDTVLVLNSNKNGIDLEAVDGVLLDTVVVDGGAKTGVKIDDCTDVEVVYSYIVNNGRNGLTLTDCYGTAVTDNEIAFNTEYGLKTHNALYVTFDNNDVHDNGVDEKHFTSGGAP